MEQGIVTDAGPDSSPGTGKTPLAETPEFKAEVERWRKEKDAQVKAEIERKTKELEEQARRQPPAAPGAQPNWFDEYEDRHGLPRGSAKELFGATVGYVQTYVMAPVLEKGKTTELKLQRADLRQSDTRLAKLDDKYHEKAMELLRDVPPGDIFPDSYKRALEMVLGSHLQDIVSESVKTQEESSKREAEIFTGPQPRGSEAPPKPKVTLTSHQQERAGAMEVPAETFVELMRDRARRLIAQGKTKEQARQTLGKDIEGIEF